MLENSNYEQTLLQTTSRILSADLHARLKRQLADARKPLAPRPHMSTQAAPLCTYCAQPLVATDSSSGIYVFKCGHAFHAFCVAVGAEEDWDCRMCSPIAAFSAGPGATTSLDTVAQSSSSASPAKRSQSQQLSAAQLEAVDRLRHSQHAEIQVQSSAPVLKLAPPYGRPNLQGVF